MVCLFQFGYVETELSYFANMFILDDHKSVHQPYDIKRQTHISHSSSRDRKPSKRGRKKEKKLSLRSTSTTLINPHKPRDTPRLLLSLLSRKPQYLNLRREPLAQRLRMKRPVRSEPFRKWGLDLFILEDLVRCGRVLYAEFVERGVFFG